MIRALWIFLARTGLCEPPCGHQWRPARLTDTYARVCALCDEVQRLEPGEFYAYFGIIPR
jgi:hypothetical protein